uniref:Glutaminase A n=1 Tax=Talaromyces marneffei PM1 TaxID=1077442 RepID=A0A093V053_TALMA
MFKFTLILVSNVFPATLTTLLNGNTAPLVIMLSTTKSSAKPKRPEQKFQTRLNSETGTGPPLRKMVIPTRMVKTQSFALGSSTVGLLKTHRTPTTAPSVMPGPCFLMVLISAAWALVQSRVFSIGLCQDEPIQYIASSGIVPQTSLYLDYFDTQLDALSFFQTDFATAHELLTALNAQLQEDSVNANGQNYAVLTTLGLRHAFGGIQWTGTEDAPLVWLKEMSFDDNMNTVDVIFPAHPACIYTNATILNYSMHDIGSHYPNATGYRAGNDEAMPLEECGNMIIMTSMYYTVSKDTAYLKQHYRLLSQWAEYLVTDSLIPANQASTDDFERPLSNQANLAIKGIVWIQAMSVIANLAGNTVDATNYSSIASNYVTDTWSLLYNAYADKALNPGIIPQSIYNQQSKFYPSVLETFSIPVDTRHQWSKSDWQVWTAATASDSTRQDMIDAVATWAAATSEWLSFSDLYETQTGAYVYQFADRPVQGGLLAVLVADMGLTV